MRAAPILIPHLREPSPCLWADAALDAMITHNDSAAIASCVAFVYLLWELLRRTAAPPPAWWAELASACDVTGLPVCRTPTGLAYFTFAGASVNRAIALEQQKHGSEACDLTLTSHSAVNWSRVPIQPVAFDGVLDRSKKTGSSMLEQDLRNHVRSPNCATRSGNWKALVNADGSGLELYGFSRSDLERENCADREPRRACELSERLLAWRRSLSVLAPA